MASKTGMPVALLAGALVVGAVGSAWAGVPGWSDAYGDGRVSVPADRSTIKLCDGAEIFRWIAWYNHRRRHSATGNLPPAVYEDRLDRVTELAA